MVKENKKKTKDSSPNIPSLKLELENEIAMDFAVKTYKVFDKMIKSIVLFGSSVKQNSVSNSDIDIVVLIDDVSIKWNEELILWYRENLEKLIKQNPYRKNLHINTIKLSLWWEDLMRGDPVVLNILRYGESLIDFGGFFLPLKYLLLKGKIKPTSEAIYNCLERAPTHLVRSKMAEMSAIEGVYWSMVDSSQAALIAEKVLPASPEHIANDLKEIFVNTKRLKLKYVMWYRDLLILHKQISHGEVTDLKGVEIDSWQEKAKEFMKVMAELVNQSIDKN